MKIPSHNGRLLYTDQRVLIALGKLIADRDQAANPITQGEISNLAVVSLRTVQNSLPRLTQEGYIHRVGGRQGVPASYWITDIGYDFLEDYE